jgi:hypothetical protein
MTRTLASSFAFVLFAIGCGGTVNNTVAKAPTIPAIAKEALAGKRTTKEAATTAVKTSGLADRAVGDFVVFKFTGSFHKGSITLTERVVAKEGAVIVIDYTMVETTPSKKGAITKEETLRAKIDTTVGSRGEVFGVQKFEKGVATPAEVADWEAMMAKTVVVADANEQTYGTEEIDLKVGQKSVTADRTVYKVLIGNKSATMSITASDSFAWGDLAGEIVTDDGNVLYKAELVESGHTLPPFVATDDDGI